MQLQQAQKMFDQMLTHLRNQGTKAYLKKGTCAYRGEHGHKCAIGCLITDAGYLPEVEGNSPDEPCIQEALKRSGWDIHGHPEYTKLEHGPVDDILFLSTCQRRLHDSQPANLADLEESAVRIAAHFNLTYTPKEEDNGNSMENF